MKCDVCGNNFKILQQREEVKNGFTRFIVYSSCNGCGAGMVHYYPFTPIEDDESSKGDA